MDLSPTRDLTQRQIATEQGDKKRQEGILTDVLISYKPNTDWSNTEKKAFSSCRWYSPPVLENLPDGYDAVASDSAGPVSNQSRKMWRWA
jgi:hypothetical protein